jgi:hypothetical protein
MGRFVDSAALEIEAEGAGNEAREFALFLDWDLDVVQLAPRVLRGGGDLRHERSKPITEWRED